MFDFQISSGTIDDDISALSIMNTGNPEVNTVIQSLVLKFIQKYFGANNINEGLNIMVDILDSGGGWSMLNKPIQEAYSIECIADISTTSAIVKEIIFNDRFKVNNDFNSCDLGSGTGILTLAAYIAGLRKGCINGKLNLVDHEEKGLKRSGDVLRAIVVPSFEVKCILGDITEPEVLSNIGEDKIDFWISETIGKLTPDFKVLSNGKVIISGDKEFYESSKSIDPFPDVVGNIVSMNPGVQKDIKNGKVAMFPDLINGLYKPKGDQSTLRLKTGTGSKKRLLSEIGGDFGNISALNETSRW